MEDALYPSHQVYQVINRVHSKADLPSYTELVNSEGIQKGV